MVFRLLGQKGQLESRASGSRIKRVAGENLAGLIRKETLFLVAQ